MDQRHLSVFSTVLVTRNFTKSADCPRQKSAVFPRNRQRVPAESCKVVRGIVKGCSWNRERVSTESWRGVRGIMKGCPRICRGASAQSQLTKASVESYCIPRIVEGQSVCSSRKGGIVIALLYVIVDRQRQPTKPSEPTYVTYLRGLRGQWREWLFT